MELLQSSGKHKEDEEKKQTSLSDKSKFTPEQLTQLRQQRQSSSMKRIAKEKEEEEIRMLLKDEKLELLSADDKKNYLKLKQKDWV